MTPITPTPAPKPVQPKRTPTSIGNPPARSLPTPGNRRAASRIPVASPERRRRDGGDSTPGAPEADGVAPTSPDTGSQDSPASPAGAATNAPLERVPHKQSPKAGASPRSSVDGGDVVAKSMHETVVARWKAAVESANETAALKRELVETKLRQEMDQLRLESEQRVRSHMFLLRMCERVFTAGVWLCGCVCGCVAVCVAVSCYGWVFGCVWCRYGG